jgi:hypothetical protein
VLKIPQSHLVGTGGITNYLVISHEGQTTLLVEQVGAHSYRRMARRRSRKNMIVGGVGNPPGDRRSIVKSPRSGVLPWGNTVKLDFVGVSGFQR